MKRRRPHAQENPSGVLFQDLTVPSDARQTQPEDGERSQGSPRVLEPNRAQVELRASDLESLLAHDHRARLV